eukprot:Gb_07649 [translate_table: standard]
MNIHPMHISGRQKHKMFLSGYNCIQVLIVIFVKRSSGSFIPYPKIHGFGFRTQRLSSPRYVWFDIFC